MQSRELQNVLFGITLALGVMRTPNGPTLPPFVQAMGHFLMQYAVE